MTCNFTFALGNQKLNFCLAISGVDAPLEYATIAACCAGDTVQIAGTVP